MCHPVVFHKGQFFAFYTVYKITDSNTIFEKVRAIMFTDDTNLVVTRRNFDDIESQFNQELKIITQWFQANLLSLNITKLHIVFPNIHPI